VKTFTCDQTRSGFSDFLAGECGRPEANLIEAHVGVCPPCRHFVESLVWQDRVIVELAGRARLDSMAARISSSLDSLNQVAVGDAEPAGPRRWIAAAAAAVLLFAAGAAAVHFWPGRTADVAQALPGTPPLPVPEVKTLPGPEPRELDPAPPPDPSPPAPDVIPVPEAPRPAPQVDPRKVPAQEHKVAQNPAPVQEPVSPAQARDSGRPVPAQRPPEKIELAPARTVDEAINRGVGFLRLRSPKLDFARTGREARPEELTLWTYFMAGLPESDPEFQRLFRGVLDRKLERTYEVALQAMLLEELDRVKYQWRIHQCAQFLADNQCKNGQWSYGDRSLFVDEIASTLVAATSSKPGPKGFTAASSPYVKDKPAIKKLVQVQKRREGPESGDNSNSMYAALGMRACHDAGVQFPEAMVRAAEKAWRDAFHVTAPDEGGWCYGPKGHAHKPYGSMTAGGIGSLVIYDYILRKDWRKDVEVKLGLTWLARNFSVSYNPGPYEHANAQENTKAQVFYFLYALERAGILFGAEKFGPHEWYKEGSKELLDIQRLDGAWISNDEIHDTCFAILFLRRATRGLQPVSTGK
jgi:hypothetical protein